MTAASIFEFHFKQNNADAGFAVAEQIGNDMPATEGYMNHEVIRDFTDSGHVIVKTEWQNQAQGEAVLGKYINDDKIKQATTLADGAAPSGFLGSLV